MFAKVMHYIKIIVASILIFAVLCICLYQELRPTIIFHTYAKSGYLGKVSEMNGGIYKLYIKNHKAKYRLPHIWNWSEEGEIAIFTNNFDDLLDKKDLDFWKIDIFLDTNGHYERHYKTMYFWNK